MSPQTSLILTVYNREQFLAAAIASVLAQTVSDFELIIWDDGSTDRSLAIAQSYAARDNRIKVIAAPHQGQAVALQAAHNLAQGEYFAWIDSDDLLAATALAATSAVLNAQPNLGFVYTDYWVIDEQGNVKGYGDRCRIPYSRDQLLVDFMTFHFRLIRRSVYQQVGGVDPKFVCAMDYDLCLRLSEVAEVGHIAQPLYFYRVHPGMVSQQRQLEQMAWSKTAILHALERRGLADRLTIEVNLVPSKTDPTKPQGQFILRRKRPSSSQPSNKVI